MKRLSLIVLINAIWISVYAGYQAPETAFSNQTDTLFSDIFKGSDVLELSLLANFDSLVDDAAKLRTVRRDASLKLNSVAGQDHYFLVKLETRGNFRMKPENCNFPPLKLIFEKNNYVQSIFLKNNSVKLVDQCQLFRQDYAAYLLQEYLIYKIYAYLSNYTFKVRLLKISYINKGFLFDTLTRYAFALEPPKEMAKRYNAKRVNSSNVALDEVDLWQYKLVCFFQYMIMNNDWSVAICHNIELIQPDSEKPAIPVPYDFDWSGIIKVPYTVPSSEGIKIIQPERSFKGSFKSRRELRDVIQFFNSKRGGIYSIVSEFKELDSSYRIAFLKSLDDYYEILNAYFTFNKNIINK